MVASQSEFDKIYNNDLKTIRFDGKLKMFAVKAITIFLR